MKILSAVVMSFFISVISLSQDGSLDPSFGAGGIVTTSIGSEDDVGYSIALQSDGKIVVSGRSYNGSHNEHTLVRYNTNGSFDVTFGTGGIVTTPIGEDDGGRTVAIQSDGKIVVGGWAYNGSDYDFALVRYNMNGSLDGTFGTGGIVTTPIGSGDEVAYAVVIQSDGKIVLGGFSDNGSDNDFALVRYNTNGSLDGTFGAGGRVITPIGSGDDIAYTIAIQSNGKIVLAGNSNDGSDNFALARYNSDGMLDGTFGTGGIVITSIGNSSLAISVVIQSDKKIVVGGYSNNGSNYDFSVVRYDTSGTLDVTFGTGGIVTTAIGSGDDLGYALELQQDGKIILGGPSDNGSNNDFAIIRYDTSGTPDGSFGTGGIVTTPIGNGNDVPYGIAIQSDWKIILVGYSESVSSRNFALARYNVSIVSVYPDGLKPLEYALTQNYPNPFNPLTKISFQIAEAGFISLKVYDVLGNEIVALVNEEKPAGEYEVEFSAIGRSASGGDAYNLTSGVYFYQLRVYPVDGGAGNFVQTKKMIFMK